MDEIEDLLLALKEEIESLRRHNELLQARTDTLDLVARLVGGVPRTQGFGQGPLWRLEKFLKDRRQKVEDQEQEQQQELKRREEEVKAFLARERAQKPDDAERMVPRHPEAKEASDRPLRQRVGHVEVDSRKPPGG